VTLSLYGPDHYKVGYARVSLAMLLHEKGDLAAAESEYRRALAIYDKSLAANHQYRGSLLMHFARLLVDRGKLEEALTLSQQSIAIWQATAGPDSPRTAQAHSVHAYALEHTGNSQEATRELLAALPVLEETWGAEDPGVRRAQTWLRTAQALPVSRPKISCTPDSPSLPCTRTANR
jgi:tetratricopeptide (TPR) repeat protein